MVPAKQQCLAHYTGRVRGRGCYSVFAVSVAVAAACTTTCCFHFPFTCWFDFPLVFCDPVLLCLILCGFCSSRLDSNLLRVPVLNMEDRPEEGKDGNEVSPPASLTATSFILLLGDGSLVIPLRWILMP